MSNASIIHGKKGQFQRDDSALRDAIIELTECVRLVGVAWEMFPEIKNRRDYMNPIYKRLELLTDELKQVDTKKGHDDGS
jgi:hypothetical protein